MEQQAQSENTEPLQLVLSEQELSGIAEKFLTQNNSKADRYLQAAAKNVWRKLEDSLKQSVYWEDLWQIGRMAFVQKLRQRNGSEADIGLYVTAGIQAMQSSVRSEKRMKRGGSANHLEFDEKILRMEADDKGDGRGGVLITHDIRASLAKAVGELDLTCSAVLKLRFAGKKQEEIAREVGITQGGVSKAVRRALRRIFDVLPSRPVDSSVVLDEIKQILNSPQHGEARKLLEAKKPQGKSEKLPGNAQREKLKEKMKEAKDVLLAAMKEANSAPVSFRDEIRQRLIKIRYLPTGMSAWSEHYRMRRLESSLREDGYSIEIRSPRGAKSNGKTYTLKSRVA